MKLALLFFLFFLSPRAQEALPRPAQAADVQGDPAPAAADSADSADSAAASADSAGSGTNPYEFAALSHHIGFNGFGVFLSFIQQLESRGTGRPDARMLWPGISGDVLTGLPFIHLIPALQYFQYSEPHTTGYVVKLIHRDVGISFYTVLISPRLTYRKARIFAGAGPSLHLSILSYVDALDQVDLYPSLKSGLGGLLGLELPLTSNVSFLLTGAYRDEFDWEGPYRKFFSVSAGVAL